MSVRKDIIIKEDDDDDDDDDDEIRKDIIMIKEEEEKDDDDVERKLDRVSCVRIKLTYEKIHIVINNSFLSQNDNKQNDKNRTIHPKKVLELPN